MKYYVVQNPDGKWEASRSEIWGTHSWRKIVNATSLRKAVTEGKAAKKRGEGWFAGSR